MPETDDRLQLTAKKGGSAGLAFSGKTIPSVRRVVGLVSGQSQDVEVAADVLKELLDAVVIRLDFVARELIAGHREPQDVSPAEVRRGRAELRSTHGPSFLAELAVHDWMRWIYDTADVPQGSLSFVIRDIETPEEIGFLRATFDGLFQLIAIGSSPAKRNLRTSVIESNGKNRETSESETRSDDVLAMVDVIVPSDNDRAGILTYLRDTLKE